MQNVFWAVLVHFGVVLVLISLARLMQLHPKPFGAVPAFRPICVVAVVARGVLWLVMAALPLKVPLVVGQLVYTVPSLLP